VAIAQERAGGGQFPDVTQDPVPVPGPDVAPVGSDKCVALVFREPEPRRLQGRNEVDFTVPGADRVPVSQHDAVPVAEQVPPVSVPVDHPGREREAEPVICVQQPCAVIPEPGAFFLIDGAAGVDRPADGDKRLIGRQGYRGRIELMQPAEQVPEIGRPGLGAVLGEVPPERDSAAVAGDWLVDRQRLHGRKPILWGSITRSGLAWAVLRAGIIAE